MMLKFYLIFCLIGFGVDGAKILGIFEFSGGKSHYILTSALMRALAERGHNVTIVAPYLDDKAPKGAMYRQIYLDGLIEDFEQVHERLDQLLNKKFKMSPSAFLTMQSRLLDNVVRTIEHENMQKLLKANETFDLVIVEEFNNDLVKILAPHYKAPLVVFNSQGATQWVNQLVNNPSPPSYIPIFLTATTAKMDFWQRLKNVAGSLFFTFMKELQRPSHRALAKKFFPEESLDDILYNPSIILLNSHPSFNQPVPHVPNMIEIGGFHIEPPKKLPQNLQEYLDNATDGFIYFSMGTNLRSSRLPDDVREAFLNNFRKLKQKVLWKFETDVLPNQPDNVKIIKWAPQQDVLAHPNIKLFITHGGLLSTTETVYHGVPILAIPVFADQHVNALQAVENGYAVQLPYNDLTEETLEEKLTEILNNPQYTETAKSKSKIFHDREAKPLDTAMFWIEYVIRHKGAPHLMIEGVHLSWYQYLLLDVIAFIVLISITILGVIFYIFRKICSRKNENVKFKQNLKKKQL